MLDPNDLLRNTPDANLATRALIERLSSLQEPV